MKKEYDIVIIGAGVTGLAAAMYAGRLGMETLVLGKSNGSEPHVGGVITTTHIVENYPGFIRISGEELAERIRKHAEEYGKVKIMEGRAMDIKMKGEKFLVKTEKEEYGGKSILFATGTKWKKLEAKGSREFENKGISYCAICDGPLYRNKTVAVIGGSDSAGKEALFLAEHAKKIYLIYRGEKIHPEPVNMERIKKNKKIEIINNANVLEVKGKEFVEKVVLDRKLKGKNELVLDGIFVAIGHIFLSELAGKLGVKLNEKGEIIINHKTCETNIQGVYAAGDVTDKVFKQAIVGVAEGCIAAYSSYQYISKGKNFQ